MNTNSNQNLFEESGGGGGAEHHPPLTEHETIVYALISIAIVTFGGLCSGLTIGLFSLDTSRLQVMTRAGSTPWKRNSARRLLFFVSRGHWTLVTLLVSNACAMSALPLVLDRLVNPTAAIILSITAVLFFGEVVPQALFVRHGFSICSLMVPLLWILLVVTTVISYPAAKLLDKIIGHQAKIGRDEVAKHIRIVEEDISDSSSSDQDGVDAASHKPYDYNNQDQDDDDDDFLPEEIQVMKGALSLSKKSLLDVKGLLPDQAFMLSSNQIIDADLVGTIVNEGHSRVPVFMGSDRNHIIGVLLTKSLLSLAYTVVSYDSPKNAAGGLVAPKVGELALREPFRVQENTDVTDLLTSFKTGKSHLACVYNKSGNLVKFVALDDIFKLLLVGESYRKGKNSSSSSGSPKNSSPTTAIEDGNGNNNNKLNDTSTTTNNNNNSFTKTASTDRPTTLASPTSMGKSASRDTMTPRAGGARESPSINNNTTSNGRDALVASAFAAIRASNAPS